MDDDYCVEIWESAMPWPLSFAVHLWFVTCHAHVVDRIEVWATLGSFEGVTLLKNAIAPTAGIRTSFFDNPVTPKKVGKTQKIFKIKGAPGSAVEKLYRDIHESLYTYPYLRQYVMWPGPNSNTYVQWVLDRHPEVVIALPRRAFGRNYLKNKV